MPDVAKRGPDGGGREWRDSKRRTEEPSGPGPCCLHGGHKDNRTSRLKLCSTGRSRVLWDHQHTSQTFEEWDIFTLVQGGGQMGKWQKWGLGIWLNKAEVKIYLSVRHSMKNLYNEVGRAHDQGYVHE